MYYYKFKVYYDEVPDFVRDVEILATDNFESFHQLLYKCIGLEGNEFAEFSICDQKWNKQKEITLLDTVEEDICEVPEYEEEDSYSTKFHLPKFVMKEAVIKNFITDPHQHIMYEYDFIHPKIFYIELQKILQTNTAEGFPRCTHKVMELPKQLTTADILDPYKEKENDIDDEINYDEENGYNDEDFSDLNEYNEFS